MRFTLIAATLTLSAGVAAAQDAANSAANGRPERPHAIVALPNTITWGPAPAVLPPGARAAVLEGDPAQPGPFTLRLSLPANYRIPPHYHPAIEHVTVLSGTFYVGMGGPRVAT